MKGPLVSVIIPTYNRLEHVQGAIDSVLRQTYSSYEVIVIDDGSTDGTRNAIPGKYADRIHYCYQDNHGRSAARNFGASLARGSFLAFLDSDDIWAPSKLERQIAEFSKQRYRDVAAVCSSAYFIDEFGNLIHRSPLGRHPALYHYELQRFFTSPIIIAPPSNMLIRKEYFDKICGFDNEMSYGEDWDLVIKLRQQWRFLYVDQPLVYFRFGSRFLNRLPHQDEIPKILSDLKRLYRKIDRIEVRNKDPLFLSKSISNIHEQAAYWYFARKAYVTGSENLSLSGKISSSNLGLIVDRLGYWGAYGAIESKGSDPVQCELEFTQEFVPNVMGMIAEESALSERHYERLLGSFYHNLAWHLFPSVNGKSIQWLCLKAIVARPSYIFSKQTMRLLAVSTYREIKGF